MKTSIKLKSSCKHRGCHTNTSTVHAVVKYMYYILFLKQAIFLFLWIRCFSTRIWNLLCRNMQLAYVLCNRFNASLRKFIDKAIKLYKNSWAPEQKQKYYTQLHWQDRRDALIQFQVKVYFLINLLYTIQIKRKKCCFKVHVNTINKLQHI